MGIDDLDLEEADWSKDLSLSMYMLHKMLGGEERYCSLQYPQSPPWRARTKMEWTRSHERRKAWCKSTIAETTCRHKTWFNHNNDKKNIVANIATEVVKSFSKIDDPDSGRLRPANIKCVLIGPRISLVWGPSLKHTKRRFCAPGQINGLKPWRMKSISYIKRVLASSEEDRPFASFTPYTREMGVTWRS